MLIGGPLAGYAGALVLAGFGELVENSGKTNRSPGTERSAYPDGERTGGDAGSEAGRSCYCEEIKPDLPDKLDL